MHAKIGLILSIHVHDTEEKTNSDVNKIYDLRKITLCNPNLIIFLLNLVNYNVYTNLVKFCLFLFRILSKNLFLKSIKGLNTVANLQNII